MKSGWRTVPIQDLYFEMFDGVHGTPKPATEGPIFLGIKNVKEDGHLDLSDIRHIDEGDFARWTKRVEPHPGDIIFSYEATLNLYGIIPDGFRGCLGRRLALIRPNPDRVDSRFLFYYFFGSEWRGTIQKNILEGATVQRIPISKFPEFSVTVPPLASQRRIASILSAYDDLIANNTRRIKILEEMAKLIYREWFVEFKAPGVKLRNATSEEKKVTGKDMFPEGWEVNSLGDIAREIRRAVDPGEIDANTPYLGLEHMPRQSIALDSWGKAKQVQSTKLAFKKGEILFGKIRPYFHKVGVAPVDGVCSSDIIVIVPLMKEFFAHVLCCVSSNEFVSQATQTSQGTKMPRANWDILLKYPVVIPPKETLIEFNDLIFRYVSLILNLVSMNINLRQTRDLLLPKLVSGEVEV